MSNMWSKKIDLLSIVLVLSFLKLHSQVYNNGSLHIGTNSYLFLQSGAFTFGQSGNATTNKTIPFSTNDGKFVFSDNVEIVADGNSGRYIDGYVELKSASETILPLGSGSTCGWLKILPSSDVGIRATYVKNSPVLSYSGAKASNVNYVSETEFWIIKGQNSKISISWRADSNLASFSFPDLTILGYKNGVWQIVPSTIEHSAFTGGISNLSLTGSIISDDFVSLEDFEAFTFGEKGVSCSELVANSGLIKTWNGTAWSPSSPTLADTVIINADYSGGSFVCNSIQLNANVILTGVESLEIVNGASGTGKIILSSESSLVQRNSTATPPIIELTKTTRPLKRFDYVFFGQPVTNNVISQLSNAMASTVTLPGAFDLMYKYVSGISGSTGGWQALDATSPGKGFILRVKDQAPFVNSTSADVINLQYSGIANNGEILVPISNISGDSGNYRNNNLLANPYPSAIDADKFLTENNDLLDGVIYLWRSNTTNVDGSTNYAISDYVAYTKAGSTAYSGTSSSPVFNGKIASGQGFKVKALSTGSIKFTNCMRLTGSNSQFFRFSSSTIANNQNSKNRFKLKLNSSQGIINQILIAYLPETTLGYDKMYDAELYSMNDVQFYSLSENSDKKLAINARSDFSEFDEVLLGVSALDTINSIFSIQVEEKEGIFASDDVQIYLFDSYLNHYHNLNEGNYDFSISSSNISNRFKIVYKGNPSSSQFDNNLFAFINNDLLQIKSKINIENFEIFDLTGRSVLSLKNQSFNNFELPFNFAKGVYVIKAKLVTGQIVSNKVLN
jgi:hypothetical protein